MSQSNEPTTPPDEFISQEEILAEIADDGDRPMDDDSDDEQPDNRVPDEKSDSNEPGSNYEQAFSQHQQPVFTISGHPTAPLAVSGGEDDLGYIWDITDGQIIVKLTGHTDSVTASAWNWDGEMVATGGMDGKVRLWRRVGKDDWTRWEFLTELQGPDEVMFLRWHPKGNVLLAGSNDSTLWLWQLPSGNIMQVFAGGHTGPVQCGDFTPDGKRIVSADADGGLVYWDPRSPSPTFKLTPEDARFDLGGITSLGINPSSTLAVIGGTNGGVRVVSLSKGEIVGSLGGHAEGESVEAITFVDVGGSSSVVVTGCTDGKALIWDLSTMRLRGTLEHEDAITTLLTARSHLVISASADKLLKVWDARTGSLVRELRGHGAPVLGASLALGGEVVLSAGDDGHCLVFTTEETDMTVG